MDTDLNVEEVRTWIELLHGDSTGFLHVCASGQWEGFVAEEHASAIAYVRTLDLRKPSGIYLRATTVKGKLPPGSRGGVKDTKSIPGLWGDVDIAGPGHKTTKPLPPTMDDAIAIVLTSGLPEPTLWIHSGGGLYPWWILQKPHEVEDEEDLEQLENLSSHWQEILAVSATKLGWHYGTETKDLARVLRIPGTINRKVPEAPVRAKLLEDLGTGVSYSLEQLYEAMTQNLGRIPKPDRYLPTKVIDLHSSELSPGDALEMEPWESSLLLGGRDSWELHHQTGGTSYWTRPGKSRRDGHSATTGYDSARDRMYVFTSSTELPSQEPLTKFAVYTFLNHGGNFEAAAGHLRHLRLGSQQLVPVEIPPAEPWNPSPPDPEMQNQTGTSYWSRFSWDDMGNAERFSYRYRDVVRYLVDVGNWTVHGAGKWEQVTEAPINALAQQLINELPRLESNLYSDEASVASNGKQVPSEQEQFLSWATKQRFDGKLNAMRRQSEARPELYAKLDDFDQDPMLLNCINGVLDLRTGILRATSPDLLLMQQANVAWDENAKCPEWERYLEMVFPDTEAREYLQRVTGYSLTGDVSERVMFLHFGGGDNGKSIFLDVIGKILGSYSIVVGTETLMTKSFQSNHNADIARMARKRFLRASETNVGKHLDEGQVKLLAGGDDVIVARYPYQKFPFEFQPTGKIHLATNHAPEVSDSNSIWRRIRLIDWNIRIPEKDQNPYLTKELLERERSGILAWAVRGCLEWQKSRLLVPPSLEARQLQLRSDQSVFGQFLEDCVREYTGNVERHGRIYQIYRMWCDDNGAKPMSGKAFTMAMQERGHKRWRDKATKGFMDIVAVTPMQSQVEWQPN